MEGLSTLVLLGLPEVVKQALADALAADAIPYTLRALPSSEANVVLAGADASLPPLPPHALGLLLAPPATPCPAGWRLIPLPTRAQALNDAVIRHLKTHPGNDATTLGAYSLTRHPPALTQGEETLSLTEKEAALMLYLAQAGSGCSKPALLEAVWHYHAEADTRTLETHLSRLNQKLHPFTNGEIALHSSGGVVWLTTPNTEPPAKV